MTKSCAVVIFTFVDFDVHVGLSRRTGSLHDVKRLEYLFYLLDMPVQKVINPTLEKFREEIDKLSKFDFTEYESILLIYMSHGEQENILCCVDGKFNFLEESKKICRNPTLNEKPKLITVQACKGTFDRDLLLYSYDDKEDISDDSQITAVLTSSFEGFVSRLGENGSMFVETFTEVLRKSWKKKPLVQIFRDFIDQFNKSQGESAATLQIRPNLSEAISNFTLH